MNMNRIKENKNHNRKIKKIYYYSFFKNFLVIIIFYRKTKKKTLSLFSLFKKWFISIISYNETQISKKINKGENKINKITILGCKKQLCIGLLATKSNWPKGENPKFPRE